MRAAAAIVARDEEVKLRKTQEMPKVKAAGKGKASGKKEKLGGKGG